MQPAAALTDLHNTLRDHAEAIAEANVSMARLQTEQKALDKSIERLERGMDRLTWGVVAVLAQGAGLLILRIVTGK